MQSNRYGDLGVKEERGNRFTNILPQFLPGVTLREDIFRQALGAVAPSDSCTIPKASSSI